MGKTAKQGVCYEQTVYSFPTPLLLLSPDVLHIRGKYGGNFGEKSHRGKVILVITILDAILYFLVCF